MNRFPGYGISDRQPGESSKDYQARAMAYIRKHIGGIGASRQGDQKAWAQRILDRKADGEIVSDYAFRLACEALGFNPKTVLQSMRGAE